MSTEPVRYELHDNVAVIRIDDGKRNALSPQTFAGIYAALDRAESDNAIVIFTGRDDVFSAGFDLNVMKRGGKDALQMLHAGYSLPRRVMSYPNPVIAACNGHVLAMGVFLMLSCDYIIGTRGDFKIAANEVAIGLTMPRVAAAMLQHRLKPAAYQRAVTLSEYFDVAAAKEAGFFDELADPSDLMPRARARAAEFANLDANAHTATKRRIRRGLALRMRWFVIRDMLDAMLLGLRRMRKT